MRSLKEFFKIDLSNRSYEQIFHSRFTSDNFHDLENLISTHFVIKNNIQINLPKLNFGLDHDTIINYCIVYLMENKLLDNLLTFGYRLGDGKDINDKLYCSMVNTNVQIIKGFLWKQLHEVIGTQNFIFLLINCTVFQIKANIFYDRDENDHDHDTLFSRQIIGNRNGLPHLPPRWYRRNMEKNLYEDSKSKSFLLVHRISNRTYLYKSKRYEQRFVPLLRSLNLVQLRDEVYGLCGITATKSIRRKIDDILLKLIKNCKKNIPYSKILEKICPSKKKIKFEEHLKLASGKKNVIHFIAIMIEKLLPFQIYGSKQNKSVILKNIVKLINLPLHGSFPLIEATENFKLKHLDHLLGESRCADRQSVDILNVLYSNFFKWLLEVLVPDIVASFFYCSEISGTTEIIFFKHSIWDEISKPFIKNYFKELLHENGQCRNHDSYLLSDYNHCRMRLVPKTAPCEFRLITVPSKGVDAEEHLEFRINQVRNVAPIQSVLKYLRMKKKTHFTKLSSISGISDAISRFKRNLLEKFDILPNLYYMKFDIANCYDSVPRQKVIAVLKELLASKKDFYVRSYTYFDSKKLAVKVKKIVNEIEEPKGSDILIDQVRTYHFTPADVLKAVEIEIFRTSLYVNDICFLRKDGLFQGSSFSALLVDLIYDDLLLHYKEFESKPNVDSLILRIADDFLVISTSKTQIDDINRLAISGFKLYNASVKKEKIYLMSSQNSAEQHFTFCALRINIKKLEVLKESSSFNKPFVSLTSISQIYKRLNSILETRLSYKTLSSNINSVETILEQVKHITSNLAEISFVAFGDKNITKDSFMTFITHVINSIYSRCNQNEIYKDNFFCLISFIVIDTFHEKFCVHQNKHIYINDALKELKQALLTGRSTSTSHD